MTLVVESSIILAAESSIILVVESSIFMTLARILVALVGTRDSIVELTWESILDSIEE